MEIVRCFNDIYKVVNIFGQTVKTFDNYHDAFDYLKEIGEE